MSKTTKHLMLKEAKMQKVNLFGFGENTKDLTRDGRLYILMRKKLAELRV
jgi:hypothetical protein